MTQMGRHIAQQYLTAFDRLIGIIGEAGSGKSLLIKGMFPGLELTNDDNGVNVRPLPLLEVEQGSGFYQPHTYHLDVRFEMAFTQPHVLASAIKAAVDLGRRVVVEHFELIYPLLDMRAELMIGIGEEIVVSRPTIFGPEPEEISKIVFASNKYRRMAHSAEDLTECFIHEHCPVQKYLHDDIRNGFILRFDEKPAFSLQEAEDYVNEKITDSLPISYHDEGHIKIGTFIHPCTGPRMHVTNTGAIENFQILKNVTYDPMTGHYLLVGLIGKSVPENMRDINSIRYS